MKKKLLFPCLLLVAVMLLTCVATLGVGAEETMTMTAVAAGEKTPAEGDVVTIADAAELKKFSAYVSNSGVTKGITFRLEADIALSREAMGAMAFTNINPIGGVFNIAGAQTPVAFEGIFDGNGKAISNIYFTNMYKLASGTPKMNGNTANMGLFSVLGEGSVVKNLTVSINYADKITGEYFGIIASKAEGATIVDCAVKCETATTKLTGVTGAGAMGGIVGYAKNTVIDGCTANFNASVTNSLGGITGVAENTAIRNCVTSGTYTHTAASVLGGVAVELKGTSSVKNCYSTAVLESTLAGDVLGGVVGKLGENTAVENCFSNVSVATGYSFVYGSLVGENNGAVKNSYALRDPALTSEDAHADIGSNKGVAENVFAYQPKLEGDTTTFIIGTVKCERDENKKDIYTFVPAEGSNVSLVDALNAWVAENETDDVKYQAWVVNGTTIVNCKHSNFVYRAYEGQAPTCSNVGHGDKHCAGCGLLLAENVEIPADPKAHASESGVVYNCLAYECIHCHETIEATQTHRIENIPCKDQTCSLCGTLVEGKGAHTRPADFDESKPCMEYFCTACNEQVHEADHDAPAVSHACQSSTCKRCGYTIPATKFHRPGRAANCTRSQVCLDCGEVIRKAKGHTWDVENPASCGAAQLCIECGAENPDAPATGKHVYDREAPTCLDSMVCTNCKFTPKDGFALGHDLKDDEHVDCGHGRSCTRCSSIIETATGDHNVDWTKATVVRAATADRTGIVEGVCADCGRMVEAYTTYTVMEDAGNALVSGGSLTFYTGSYVDAVFGKVADYKDIAYAEGYLPLQVVTLSLKDASDAVVNVAGNVTVKVVLNKSVAKLASASIKLYQVKDGQATEVTISANEDGYITFTASAMGTFVLAGEKTEAYAKLGTLTVTPQQTAALIGTAAYERRDFDL